MTAGPDQWDKVEGLYHAALARPAGERAAFLAEACGGDEALRRDVESLLAQPASADNVLARGAAAAAAGLISHVSTPTLASQRIGAYQILAPLGAGGMGEVYRARDTRLGRDVAIKILPRAFTADADRLARFAREARVLASLNHPHIGAIHGVEDSDGIQALVLEYVEGETLAQRIARAGSKGLPLKEALDIARQIAEALDAAHEKGIVHRDLKPANIKITPQGVVKVLDFGLAKLNATSAQPASTESPTLTIDDTREGLIVGTAAYMSPEQARGQAVDKRTDIWAFGCVLYEMLTGRAAFAGATISDTIAVILQQEPDWSALPAQLPPAIDSLLRRSLEKNPRQRLRDIGDALSELRERPSDQTPKTLAPSRSKWGPLLTVAVIAMIAGWLVRPVVTSREDSAGGFRFTPFATEAYEETFPAWSHDGKTLAYVAAVGRIRQIFTKNLDSAVPAQVTTSQSDCSNPFWSPDGARIYYNAQGRLWSVSAAGGQPTLEIDNADAASIAADGKILAFLRGAGGNRSLWFAASRESSPEQYQTPPFPKTFTRSWSIDFSRDGSKLAVLLEQEGTSGFEQEMWIVPYPSGVPRRVPLPLVGLGGPTTARVDWTPDNRHIVFDATIRDVCGNHLQLLDTQDGTTHSIAPELEEEWTPAVSPDGDRIAFAAGGIDFDVLEFALDGSPLRTLVSGSRSEQWPAWAPSGEQLAYVTNATGCPELRMSSLKDGWGVPLLTRASGDLSFWIGLQKPSFSPDGRRLAYGVINRTHGVYVSPVAGGRPIALDRDSIDQHNAAWSPDGSWLAYQRLHAGRWELVKAPLGGGTPIPLDDAQPGGGTDTAWSPKGDWIAHVKAGALWLVSSDGSTRRVISSSTPVTWGFSHDGSELYAIRRPAEGGWELVTIDVANARQVAAKVLPLPRSAVVTGFALHPDGKRFATSVGIAKFDIWLLDGLNAR